MKKITLILFTLISCYAINAQTVSIVGTSYSTITEAITAASDGDIISITGIHTESLTIQKSITLRGTDPTTDIIQAAGTASSDGTGTRVISVSRLATEDLNVTIENLGIRHGNGSGNGGGINADKVTGLLTLHNLIIENNHAATNGGGLSFAGTNATILECTIQTNTSTLDGGGIIAAPNNGVTINNVVTIQQSLIDSNTGRNGGGIYINGNNGFGDDHKIDINIENSTISNNIANSGTDASGGGAIWSKVAVWVGNATGNINLSFMHATLYNNSHTSAGKNGYQSTGSSNTNFSAYNSIIVTADDITQKAVNFAKTSTSNVVNCILGGLNSAPSAIIDDVTKNNQKGKTAVQAGIAGSLTDEGGKTQVLAIADASNAVDFCTATITGVSLPNIDQRGATRTGTPDAGAFELGGTLNTNNYEFAASISVYPNPAKNIVNISGIENIEAIEVYSVLGKLVKKVTNQNTVSVHNLSKGIYLMSIKKENNTVTKQLIVE